MKRTELFANFIEQNLPSVSCEITGISNKYKILITGGIVFGVAVLEILDSKIFITQIQVVEKRKKYGTKFVSSVEDAARIIGINKLCCRPISSDDGANNGVEFFSAIGFKSVGNGLYEKHL